VTDSTLTTVTAGDDDTQAEDGGDLLLEEDETAVAAMEVEPVESQEPDTVESAPPSTLAVNNEGDEQKVIDAPVVSVESTAPINEDTVLAEPVENNDTAATNHSSQPNGHPVSSQQQTETLEPSSLS
jgi:hypothetical protein